MSAFGLRINPLDVLFFRDGRPFDAASRAVGGLPSPQTLAGAVRTALLSRTGFDFRAFNTARKGLGVKAALAVANADQRVVTARFRGPWPSLFQEKAVPQEAVPLFAAPADLAQAKKASDESAKWVWLNVKKEGMPGWKDADGLWPLLPLEPTDTKAAAKLFTLGAIRHYLNGELPGEVELFRQVEIYDFDDRTGIKVNADTLTAGDGQIYGVRLLAMKPKIERKKNDDPPLKYHDCAVGLYAEIHGDFNTETLQKWLAEPIPFGGEGHYVQIKVITPIAWPTLPKSSSTKWYLASPAFVRPRGRLPAIDALRAAAQGAGVPISGWDVAENGPRATRFAAPAGSVYFVDGSGPQDNLIGGSEEEKVEGWGFALPGTWSN